LDIRPACKIVGYKKKIIYFVYSLSNQLLNNKRKPYFNRSNTINKHRYSIRIEIYELNIDVKPQTVVIWKYPIYFDYLPAFRLSKVFRLIEVKNIKNHVQAVLVLHIKNVIHY
jgi:hypothetical protein